MQNHSIKLLFQTSSLLILCCPLLEALQPKETLPGFTANNIYESRGIDNVSPFSGDPAVVIPLGPEYPLGPNNTFQLRAHYSSKFWTMDDACSPVEVELNADVPFQHALIRGYPTLGAGWTLELGSITFVDFPSGPPETVGDFTYLSPDGGSHYFAPEFPDTTLVTTDGTNLRGTYTTVSGQVTELRVWFPDGTVHIFGHRYKKPTSNTGSGDSLDFTDEDWDVINYGTPLPPKTRFGLTSIRDSFDKELLRVQYFADFPSKESWRVSSIDLVQQVRTINFQWYEQSQQIQVLDVKWNALKTILFPAIQNKTLAVNFFYQTAGFKRNSFDNSLTYPVPPGFDQTTCRNRSDGQTPVHLLDRIQFSESALGSTEYKFEYTPPTDSYPGTLKSITTPNLAKIDYEYGTTSGGIPCLFPLGCEDPETGEDVQEPPYQEDLDPSPPLTPPIQKFQPYLDRSAAVIKRKEWDPVTELTSEIDYERKVMAPAYEDDDAVGNLIPAPGLAVRRVIVKRPGGNGSAKFATRYVFHIDVESGEASGIELARREYANDTGFGTPIRSWINCHNSRYDLSFGTAPKCGYRNELTAPPAISGKVRVQPIGREVHRTASITWYGANPVGGETCPNGNIRCLKQQSSQYNLSARKYEIETTSTNLPGMPGWGKRVQSTSYTPQIDATHWLLDLRLFDSVLDADSSGLPNPNVPVPNSSTTFLQFNQFTGFLEKKWIQDNSGDKVTTTYTTDSYGNPQVEKMQGEGTGFFSGVFYDDRTFQTGLSTSRKRTGFLWKQFDVSRDPATSLVTEAFDPNPTPTLKTVYAYDALGRITSISPPDELPTTICYQFAAPNNPALTIVKKGAANSCSKNDGVPGVGSGSFEAYQYDGFGRILRKIRRLPNQLPGGSYFAKQETRYDIGGNQAYVSEWTACTVSGFANTDVSNCLYPIPAPALSGAGGTSWSNFDPFGRAQTITKPDFQIITYSYIDDGSLSGESFTIPFSDTLEEVRVSIGGQTSKTITRKDFLGRIVAVAEPAVDGVVDVTTYKYNVLDKLAKVEQGVQPPRTFEYDAIGFLRKETTPEKGLVHYKVYDALGNVKEKIEGSITVTNTYDALGRIKNVSTNEGGSRQYLNYTYDGNAACPSGSGPSNHVLGKLTTSIGKNESAIPAASITHKYLYCGPGGRLSHKKTTAHTLPEVTQKWNYNNLGMIASHYHPRQSGLGLFVVSTDYASGVATTLLANGLPVVSGITYHPSGILKSYTTGNNSDHNVTTTIDISATSKMARPDAIYSTIQGVVLPVFNTGFYSYDGAGNISAIGQDNYSYDGRSRLISSSLGAQTFDHDRWNNLTQKGTQFFTHNTKNRLTNNNAAYDVRGNLTAYGTEIYAYDGLNRMLNYGPTSASPKFHYLYDGSNERIVKVPPTGSYIYSFRDEGKRVITQFANTNPSRDNIYLGNLLVASYEICSADPNNCRVNGADVASWQYFASDHLGSPRLVTDPYGNIVDGRKYLPFGEPVTTENFLQPTRFASMERDTEGSRYYDHARSQDFLLGRFLSPDLLMGNVQNPQTWNRYTYASNNPINRVDPDGLRDLGATSWEQLTKAYEALSNTFSIRSEAQVNLHPTILNVGVKADTLDGPDAVFKVAGKNFLEGQTSLGKLVTEDKLEIHAAAKHDFGAGPVSINTKAELKIGLGPAVYFGKYVKVGNSLVVRLDKLGEAGIRFLASSGLLAVRDAEAGSSNPTMNEEKGKDNFQEKKPPQIKLPLDEE